MRRVTFRMSRQESWLLLLLDTGMGEMAAKAALGIVGILSSALPNIALVGALL